jgi:hypothetical protein
VTRAVTPPSSTLVTSAPLEAAVEVPGLLVVDDSLVSAEGIASLRAQIGASRLLGASQLDGGFCATRGFGVACHARAVDAAVARVPLLGPFVDIVMEPALWDRLLRPTLLERAAAALLGSINALYLNVLVVPPGAGVGRHVDATLGVATAPPAPTAARRRGAGQGGAPPPPPSPRLVVVVYVDVPDDLAGGALRLFRGDAGVDDPVAVVAPRAGRLVAFAGGLGHEVTMTTSPSGASRISCVAELYALPPGRLRRLPRVRLQSHGFAAVLSRLRGPRAGDPTGVGREPGPPADGDADARSP